MSQENQSYLRFALEESVWFQKGQEVGDLYSISLDPNVTIQEDEHYVYIRGSLDLSGEYTNHAEGEVEADISEEFLQKAIQSVERNSDGVNEFIHRFPVDIMIPSSRISSLDQIDVSINSFDYTLPEQNCLKLQAELIISGIYNEAVISNARVVENNSEVQEEVEEIEAQDNSEETFTPSVAAAPSIPDFQPAFQESEQQQEDEIYEPFIVEAKRVEEEVEEQESIQEQQEIPILEIPVAEFEEEVVQREEEPEVAEEVSIVNILQYDEAKVAREQPVIEPAAQEEKVPVKKESISIIDFFGRKQEEEHVRVKVCIVQAGDTLDDLAERYNVSVQTLVINNDLEPSGEVYEGQVLYIPKVVSFNKNV